MKPRTYLWLCGAAVFVLLLSAPFLIPQRLVVPRLQLIATAQLSAPVEIGGARVVLLPFPHFLVSDVTIGAKPFLEIDSMMVRPTLSTVFSSDRAVRDITLTGVRARQAVVPWMETLARAQLENAARVRVETITLRQLDLMLDSVKLLGIGVDVELGAGNSLRTASLRLDADHARMLILPGDKHYVVAVKAHNWTLPGPLPLRVSSLEAQGKLTSSSLVLNAVKAELYDGTLQGNVVLDWNRDWNLSGEAVVTAVEVRRIAAMYSAEVAVSGRLNAVAAFRMRSALVSRIATAPEAEVAFEVRDGVLHKVDLAAAATVIPGKEIKRTGQTRFDRFSGHLSVDSNGFHFTGLTISSGAVNANGFVSISPARTLSGRMDTALKGTASLVGTPLEVSGTVDDPVVRPTKGTLAGAAAGTLLLGPGVGTTIGMKAGQLTERLFGKKPPKPGQLGAPSGPPQAAATDKNSHSPTGRR